MSAHTSYLAQGLSLPPSLHELGAHLQAQFDKFRERRVPFHSRRDLFIGNFPVSYRTAEADSTAGTAAPKPTERTIEELRDHVVRLIGSDMSAAAREWLIQLLGLDGPDEIAWSLQEVEETAPDAVTALLDLDIGKARSILDWLERDAPARESLSDLLVPMAKVRAWVIVRCRAEQLGLQLAAPFGIEELDTVNPSGAPRFGSVRKRLEKEMRLVEKVVDLYGKNRRVPVKPSVLERGVAAPSPRPLRLEFSALNMPVSPNDTKFFGRTNLEARANLQLDIWRREHGGSLEDLLEETIARIRADLKTMRRRLRGMNTAYPDGHNMRVGNLAAVPPLIELALLSKLLVAWTLDDSGRDNASDEIVSGAARLVSWIRECRHAPAPKPALGPNSRRVERDVFTLLRYAFVGDDEMLPDRCRHVTDQTGKPVHLRTQADAKRVRGEIYTFEELWSAYEEANDSRPEPMEAADRLVAMGAGRDHENVARVLSTACSRYQQGFRLPVE